MCECVCVCVSLWVSLNDDLICRPSHNIFDETAFIVLSDFDSEQLSYFTLSFSLSFACFVVCLCVLENLYDDRKLSDTSLLRVASYLLYDITWLNTILNNSPSYNTSILIHTYPVFVVILLSWILGKIYMMRKFFHFDLTCRLIISTLKLNPMTFYWVSFLEPNV